MVSLQMWLSSTFSRGGRLRERCRAGSVVLVAVTTLAGGTKAEPKPATGPVAGAPGPPPCPVGRGAAVVETACELARGLGTLGTEIVVAAGAPTGDRPSTRGAELATLVARTVATALRSTRPPLSGALPLGEARARAKGARVVVFVAIDISSGRFRLTADAYDANRSFWDRVRSPAPNTVAHAFAERRLDGEIGSYLSPLPLVSRHVDKAAGPSDVAAIACGDVDGDGSIELVVAGRRRIEVGRLRKGRFASTGDAVWAELAPVAPSPLREPIGAVVITDGRYVDAGLSDRGAGVRLGPTLDEIAELSQAVPWFGAGCLTRTGIGLGAPRPCAPNESASAIAANVTDADAFAGTTVVSAEGVAHLVVAYRERTTSTVVLLDDAGRTVRIPDAGGQIALADLNLDGEPELAFSSNTRRPADDALTVKSWSKDGSVRDRFRLPVPDGIRALAACPGDDASMGPIVLATGGGIWVVR